MRIKTGLPRRKDMTIKERNGENPRRTEVREIYMKDKGIRSKRSLKQSKNKGRNQKTDRVSSHINRKKGERESI